MATAIGKITAIKPEPAAKQFLDELLALGARQKSDNGRFFKSEDDTTRIAGVRMASLFALAKKYIAMPLAEIEKLLASKIYEARMGAVSIMDFQARDKKITDERRKDLYKLYIKQHKRINNWDMVDRAAPYVVGGYLFTRARAPLYKLARSKHACERRTAIVATWFFIRQNETEDTFKIAALLVHDRDELVNKAVGSWIREAGKRDQATLLAFLDTYAATMPRVTLRYAMEKLEKKQKEYYMKIPRKR